MKTRTQIIMALAVACLFLTGIAAASEENDLNEDPSLAYPSTISSVSIMAASIEGSVDNGDGTFTFTQQVDRSSTAPHYIAPSGYGFGIYSWWDEDYGWMHTFPNATDANLTINSVKLIIRAYDVDSNVNNGEFDHITGDGIDFDPVYLQGASSQWSITEFDVTPALIADGNMTVFIDIDMNHNEDTWATTLDSSKLVVNYSYGGNVPPYVPELSVPTCVADDSDLLVTVMGPNPADPDGDAVVYTYRWFVDVGAGYLDDNFAGRGDHTGSTVPAADTQIDDKWKVRVTATDIYGAQTFSEIEFPVIVLTCQEEEIPEFPTIALPVAAIIGLAFFMQRRKD
ncbi:PEF-CTERM sorting domain-containing protein [Methanococcoides alaskense]|uniref:PEF-CTERM protein sorting domain-containing protein n=1 Tax=Methanococcoides alaskense TaxID=325778 RepID=A0AA90Z8D5_9EURY|nr:PEF-CTERM sorting domain-containing protein [Methanococcoides alaskense]MDA0525723.1 PEF-CTERM sorting domain-containing protein [Methanococcoides alaskense]MDR6222949.1 hypothetical protein [Methanococcoides alaskense]